MSKTQGPINSGALISLAKRDKVFAEALKCITKLYKKEKRQYTGLEYASHPMTVISLLMDVGVAGEALVAAALEDVLVRTNMKESSVRAQFGDAVADMVLVLTAPRLETRAASFAVYREQLMSAPDEVKSIKLASLLDEVCAVPAKNLSAAFELIDGAAGLLDALASGNAELHRRLQAAVRRARA